MSKDSVPNYPTWAEWVLIIVFSVSMLWSLNYPNSVGIAFSCFLFALLIDSYFKNVKFREKVNKIAEYLMIFVMFMAIIDTISTYYSVHYVKIANEANPVINFLWNEFGVVGGEFFRITIGALALLIIYKKTQSNNKIQSFLAVLLTIFCLVLWTAVLINNLSQIYVYNCLP